MKLNKFINYSVNLINKVSKTVSNSLSWISNMIRLKRNYRISDINIKSYESLSTFGGCRCFLMDFKKDGEIIFMDKK